MVFPHGRLHYALLALLVLVFTLAASIPTWADSVSYEISFTTLSGPTVSNGSFQFDSLGQTNTVIGPPATFVNLQAFVGGTLFTGTSPSDDSAVVDGKGLVTSILADLEPANNPLGNILQLFSGASPTYTLLTPDMMTQLGSGTYTESAVPEPSTLSLFAIGILLCLVGLRRAERRFTMHEATPKREIYLSENARTRTKSSPYFNDCHRTNLCARAR